MNVLLQSDRVSPNEKCVVSVGNFDGVHKGHQILIRHIVQQARERGACSALVTFEPHTRAALYPELPHHLLTTFDEKVSLIEGLGIDYLMKINFDQAFSEASPEVFVEEILQQKLHTIAWIMGEGHAIGKNRSGGKKFLHDAVSKYHIDIFTADLLSRDSLTISSTQIRKFVMEGRVTEAVEMLGHPYLISAVRTQGLKIGSQLGYPTLNFKRPPSQKVIPPPGVYAAELEFKGNVLPGALYFGDCPTFAQRDIHFEFHALQFNGQFPEDDETALIWLYRFIRNDRSFLSTQELVEQIRHDVNEIRHFFSEEKRPWR